MRIFNNELKRLIPLREVILMVAADTGWGVKGMVFRRDEALVLLNPNGGYDLPGGRLEGNETCLVGLRREILEGTGIKKVVVTSSFAPWSFRNGSGRLVKGTLLLSKYVTGVSLSGKHSGFRWTALNQIKHSISITSMAWTSSISDL